MAPSYPAYEYVRPVTSMASVLIASNPGPLTLDGTNTWILKDQHSREIVVVDPGPDDERHIQSLRQLGLVCAVLITHRHRDHMGGLEHLVEMTGADVYAPPGVCEDLDPIHLQDELHIQIGCGEITAITTPGHTADSFCFLINDAVITGDTILGRGTTVLDPNDGDLGDYLASLQRLQQYGERWVLPGHGPELSRIDHIAQEYLSHRRQRLESIYAATDKIGNPDDVEAVTRMVYGDLNPELWPMAIEAVRMQLDYLRRMI